MFQPFLNPIGFGASDFIELFVFLPLFLLFLFQARIESYLRLVAGRPVLSLLILAGLPVAMRLALLSHHPVPAPNLYDEFTHLLVADTLRHFRLANPPHPLPAFFETFFVLQEPTYSAIYPIGQGAALALGRAVFGHPWAGVLLPVGALCAAVYWMLRAWIGPVWAFLGGWIAVALYGPLSQWTNSYWGGAVSATAGCLVFGALPRLADRGRARYAVILGLGLGLQVLTRPYESAFLAISVVVFLSICRVRWKLLPAVAIIPAAALAVTGAHNVSVTGSWITLPALAGQYQYGVPTSFTFQKNPTPHRVLTPQQELSYKQQVSFHGDRPESAEAYVQRLGYRARYFRFFLPAAVWLALPFCWLRLRERRFAWALGTVALFVLGANFYPFFFPHYVAAAACLVILAGVMGIESLARWSKPAGVTLLWLAVAPFLFWYGIHLFENPESPLEVLRYETGDVISHSGLDRRGDVRRRIEEADGKHLVFVRYSPRHIFQDEWVYNEADPDAARIVWARDSGPAENEKLTSYYKDRKAWLLEPDFATPKLNEYHVEPPPPAAAPPPPAPPSPRKPVLRFEEVK